MEISHLISKLNVTGVRLLRRLTLLSDTFTTLASQKIDSLNFEQHIWLTKESNWNPYKTLPLVFNDDVRKGSGSILNVADGGAAMNAYTLLQFQGLTESERNAYKLALLRYCELDTMAMVMIIEGLMELSKKHS